MTGSHFELRNKRIIIINIYNKISACTCTIIMLKYNHTTVQCNTVV
uniref:Uncharacterized protein n=1 Tax=Amphimedon queenslandica TaxID=400682 RepID=A0A1X7T4K5_AMPQE